MEVEKVLTNFYVPLSSKRFITLRNWNNREPEEVDKSVSDVESIRRKIQPGFADAVKRNRNYITMLDKLSTGFDTHEDIKTALIESIKKADPNHLDNDALEADRQPNQTPINADSSNLQQRHIEAAALWKQGRWTVKSLTAKTGLSEWEIRGMPMDFRATLNIILRARNRNESSERSARNQRVMYAIREALVQFTNKPSTLNDIVSATRRILHPEPPPSKSTVWRVLRNSLQMRYNYTNE